jgi:hypothetical protein
MEEFFFLTAFGDGKPICRQGLWIDGYVCYELYVMLVLDLLAAM